MKQRSPSTSWLLALVAGAVLFSIFLLAAWPSVVSFKEGVDKVEGTRIFTLVKPIIDERCNETSAETRYLVSRFDGNWAIEVFEKRSEFVPGGRFLFLFSENGDLIHHRGGI